MHIVYFKQLWLENVSFSGSTARMLLPLFYTPVGSGEHWGEADTAGRGASAWQGSGGDCPGASPRCPAGRCPWVSHPCGSRPRTFTSTQFVAIVVCKWRERGAAFRLAASAGEGGLRARWAAVAFTCAAKPGGAVTRCAGSHTCKYPLLGAGDPLRRGTEPRKRQKDSRDFTKYFKSILISFLMKVQSSLGSSLCLNCSFLPSAF